MERAELFLRCKRALRVVLPFALSLDMVHNIFYVARLYQTRLEEWQQEDFDKTKAEVIVSLHQVLLRCQRQDRTLWPEAVTTAFQSAISPVPCAASAGAATALETATVAAQRNGSPHQIASGHADVESQDVFGQLCCGNWCTSADNPGQSSQLAVESDLSSDDTTAQTPSEPWVKKAMSNRMTLLTEWFSQLQKHMPNFALSKQCLRNQGANATAQRSHVNAAAATAAHVTADAIFPSSQALQQCKESQPESWHDTYGHGLTSKAYQVLDQWPSAVKQMGCPWPCMQIDRRSAVRWHVRWHGFIWPIEKELSLNLDSHY